MSSASINRRVRDAAAKPVLRFVLYLRVSSKRQTDTDADVDPLGNSIDTQRKMGHDKARALGGMVVREFVEPAKSGQTREKRPEFQKMMAFVREDGAIDGTIVYSRSRAFRNYVDAGNTEVALGTIGVKLISSSPHEEFGEGNMAQAMKAIMDVFNWLQVKQSGDDIKIKMGNKARNGGTIGKAKLGYINTTKELDGRKVNTIALDGDRHHFIPMAFELWATGKYPNIEGLRVELIKAGLRMPRTGKPISEQRLYDVLRDRYYLGFVEYEGMEYPGRHPKLVDQELFDRVQRVFDTHGGTGTRQRSHNHYLKGTVWCGRCQHRFIVQRAVGRGGGEYYYFYCRGRQEGLCDMPSVPVEVMEAAVVAHYGAALTLPPGWLAAVRAGVDEAVNANEALTDTMRQQYADELTKLDRKENYFLDLAAEEGWPKDKLRGKVDDIRTRQAEIERTLSQSGAQLDTGRDVFYAALDLLERPQDAYERGNDPVRAVLNRAFFTRLYVDGNKITEHAVQEPFTALLDAYRIDRLRCGVAVPKPRRDCETDTERKEGLPKPNPGGQFFDKPSNVDDTGIEPVTPTVSR